MISDLWARIWRRSPAAVVSHETALGDTQAPLPAERETQAADTAPINPGKVAITDPLPPASPLTDLAALSPADRRAAMLQTINPALAWLGVRGVPATDAARVMLLAIAGQESDCQHRRQIGGPARGLYQFESGGGVRGVLMHRSSARLAAAACEWRGVKAETPHVWAALEHDDVLAAMFARLLLWTDPRPLPADEGEAWDYYLRNWRPGAYTRGDDAERAKLRAKWSGHWKLAREAVE